MSQAPPPKLNLRRLESIQRLLQYGAAAVLLVFLALIAFSAYKLIQINKQIDAKQAELAQLTQTIEKQKQELVQSNEKIERQDVTLETLINPNQPLNTEQAEQVKQTVEEKISQQNNNNAALIPPRIYIQIGREDQRKRAGEIARRLHAAGYLAPGVENVHEKAPPTSQLRYYQMDEVAQTDIRNLLEFFRSIGVHLDKPVQVRNSGGVRPRHYEIWFGDDFGRPAHPAEPETPRPTPLTHPTRKPTPEPTLKPKPPRIPLINVFPTRPRVETQPTRLSRAPSANRPSPSGK